MTDKQLSFQDVFNRGNELRKAGRWAEALRVYKLLLGHGSDSPVLHNMAVCHFAEKRYERAHESISRALQIDGKRWESRVLFARICTARGLKADALAVWLALHRERPADSVVAIELAELLFKELGDVVSAKAIAKYINAPIQIERRAKLLELLCSLYEGGGDAEDLTRRMIDFAKRYLVLNQAELESYRKYTENSSRSSEVSERKKVILLSSLFTASPVYFLTYSTFQVLSEQVDLIIVNRGAKKDWATLQWKQIAKQWIDAVDEEASDLAIRLRVLGADAIFDLSGWMDIEAMRALSVKPVRKQIKWVGGQSATTGMDCFDAFIADVEQIPLGEEVLYTEPIVRIDGGYVAYTPPAYLPAPRSNFASGCKQVWGVSSNPAKLSPQFFNRLVDLSIAFLSTPQTELVICFVDRRYSHQIVRDRITLAFKKAVREREVYATLEFKTPPDHPCFLESLKEFDKIIDSEPYTGGLTYIEAAVLNVPVEFVVGRLFCERHAFGHSRRLNSHLGNDQQAHTIAKKLLSNF